MNSVYGFMALAAAATAPTPAPVPNTATVEVGTESLYFVNGDLLLKACTADEKTGGPDVCKFYIGGVVDTITSNQNTIQGYHICWPKPRPNADALRTMVIKYMRDRPQFLNGIAASIVDTALYDAYPCSGSTPPPGDQFLHKN